MDSSRADGSPKPATAARIYDYYLGGVHNFPADQEAARRILEQLPTLRIVAKENRAFLARAVRYLVGAGIRQFLDIGSGIPTEGNVHEIAQDAAPDARVAYVDIDPVAVAESLELLDGNASAVAVRADLRNPAGILSHPGIIELIDFSRPVGLLLGAILHFVPDDDEAYKVVGQLVDALPSGSYVVISAAAEESFVQANAAAAAAVYEQRTTTGAAARSRDAIRRFFTGLDMVEPGVVWLHWWPDTTVVHPDFAADPAISGQWAGVGRKP